MSMSSWRSRLKPDDDRDVKEKENDPPVKAIGYGQATESKKFDDKSGDKKWIWRWKSMRALLHIGMENVSCLFSVEVVSIQGLPASMNGLRLAVCVRKKETKDGTVQTMPSRVSQGAAKGTPKRTWNPWRRTPRVRGFVSGMLVLDSPGRRRAGNLC